MGGDRINYLIKKVHQERGLNTERVVRGAIQVLLDDRRLDSVQRTEELDRRGIDYLVGMDRKKYKLSVKSSEGGVRHDLEKHPDRHIHNDIIFVVPGRNESEAELANRIIGMISSFEERMHQR